MNHKPEQFADMVKNIRLSDEERERMRAVLQSHMRQSAVREQENGRQLLRAGWFRTLSLSVSKSMVIALILAVSLALGGGVSLAAEQALPGDVLYPVKVRVNEEVREALSVSAQGKAHWETRRAERRLEEAEQLAVEGRLDDEVRLRIEERFREHTEKVRERVKKFQEDKELDSAVEISARLEVSLRAHERILSRLQENADGQAETLRLEVKKEHKQSEDLDDDVKAEVSNDDDEDEDDEEEASSERQEAAENKLKSAKRKIDEVRAFILKAKVSDETKAEGEKRLLEAEGLVAGGEAKVTAKDYNAAFLSASDAHRLAQEVKLFVAAEQALSVRMSFEKREDKKDDNKDKRGESRKDKSTRDADDDDTDQDEEDNRDDEDEENEDEDEDDDENDAEVNAGGLEVKVKIRR